MATVTDQELLDLARSELKNRLEGGGYQAYSMGSRRFEGATLLELHQLVAQLEAKTRVPARLVRALGV